MKLRLPCLAGVTAAVMLFSTAASAHRDHDDDRCRVHAPYHHPHRNMHWKKHKWHAVRMREYYYQPQPRVVVVQPPPRVIYRPAPAPVYYYEQPAPLYQVPPAWHSGPATRSTLS